LGNLEQTDPMLDLTHKLRFMEIFNECVKNGWDTCSARDYSEMCITGEPFHNYEPNNNQRDANINDRGITETSQSI
jgi:hypothetical protein